MAEWALNQLFFGDNLDVLRESIKGESVDLVYLDPPFNSKADYNVLFKTPKGHQSDAQITAFEDTWHWGTQAEREFGDLLTHPNTEVAEVMRALRQFLHENDVLAYLTMMANRLLELHRVLKPNGSLYLHCDPTASHYLKIVLDAVFGIESFKAEIIWKRTNARGTAGNWPHIHDTLLFYAKSSEFVFHQQMVKGDKAKIPHTLITKADGLKYQTYELTAPGKTEKGESGKPWRSFDPAQWQRHWGNTHAQMDKWDAAGLIHWPKKGGFPRRIDDTPFDADERTVTVGDVWVDIDRINQAAAERLGYPTQKPLALLERIITASSDVDAVILDPFCGCGTAVHAAQKLGRKWIGIDITHLAISLIEKRMRDAFPGIEFEVHGTPKDYEGARNLAERDKYQFQWWACSLVNAQPYGGKKKGADGGVDGVIFFQDDVSVSKKIIVSVKGGENVGVTMVKDLIATIIRQKAEIGLFVTLNEPTKPMMSEAAAAGFYVSPTGATFPRIQILQIENLIEGTESARYPNLDAGALTFKKAGIEQGEDKQVDLFAAPVKASKKKKT
jgi:DNA modification methylase